MKKQIFLVIAAFFFAAHISAAVFSGTVLDIRGMPIPYATVYIHETATGVATDKEGRYRVMLKPGDYNCEVSSLGYKRVKFKLKIGTSNIVKNFVLEDEVYQLSDVYIRAGQEDRAYHIMRNAIARAPYHRHQVRNYKSLVYTKGNATVTKLPALLKLRAGRTKTKLVLNKTFVLESHSEIEYEWPDQYEEKIKAFSSTVPAEIDPADISAVITASVYDRMFYGKLSPLAPEAFNYYKFVYEGICKEEDRVVNKVKIIPKGGDSKLISGYIYIADDLWNVTYAHFFIRESGVSIELKVNYNETAAQIMLPTSYSMDLDISVMGVKANGHYNSSLSYLSVNRGQKELKVSQVVTTDSINSAREARSLANKSVKVIEKEIEEATLDEQLDESERREKSYELKSNFAIKKVVDSLAVNRDSSYWDAVRVVPLKPEELLSYKEADSLKEELDKVFEEDLEKRIDRTTGNKILDKIIYETRFKVNEKLILGYGGLSKVIGGFSFTDGYWLGQNFFAGYRFNDKRTLTLKPSFYYSTYRKKMMWRVDVNYKYSPLRLGEAILSFGHFSRDISNNSSISDFVGSYASFLFAQNPKKYLSARWIEVGNSIDLANGLNLDVKIAYSHVKPLENGNIKVLSGKEPQSNNPQNIYGAKQLEHKNLEYSATMSYNPHYFYKIVKGRKVYVKSSWPMFTLNMKGTFPNSDPDFSEWAMLSFSIAQRIKTGLYSQLIYDAQVGTFYNKKNIYLDNYNHFRASDIAITEKSFTWDLLLANPYIYSTPNEWVRYNAEFRSGYIFLNYLPFLNSALYIESLYLKGLWLPQKKILHSELGYSFGIQGFLRAGVFTAFEGSSYKGVGFRLEIPILSDIYR